MADSDSSSSSAAPALPRSLAGRHNPWLIAVVVSIATFMEVLDTSIANVSLTHIAGDLAAGYDESTWVLTSYLVANAIILPISGWLANVFGRKRFYMSCVALFTISSLLCGLAPSLSWLIFFRVLQGIGGGGLAPSEQSILADSFRPEQRGAAFAIYGIAVVFAPAIGPTLGGWITDNYSWHWIFLINVPVGIMSLSLSHFLLTEPKAETNERKKLLARGVKIDYLGFALVAIGLGCLQVVLDKGERDDWFESHFINTFLIVSIVSLVALVLWELNIKNPIIALKLYANRTFAVSNILMFALGFILLGTTQLLPQLTQSLYGYTATLAGLVITPGGFAVMVMMPLVGFLVNKTQPKYLIMLGMLIETVSMVHLSHIDLNASYAQLAVARIYQAVGIAFLFVPITAASYVGIPAEKSADASALLNLMRNLGGSFGISLAQTWISRGAQRHQAYLVGHLTPADAQYQAGVATLQRAYVGTGTAGRQVLGILYQEVSQQAQILSYLDVFRILAGIALCAGLLPLLLKSVRPGQAHQGH